MRFRVGVNARAGNGDVAPPRFRNADNGDVAQPRLCNASNGDVAQPNWAGFWAGGRKSVGMPHAVSWLFRFLLHDVVVSSKRQFDEIDLKHIVLWYN